MSSYYMRRLMLLVEGEVISFPVKKSVARRYLPIMDGFLEGYMAGALWSSMDDNGVALDQNYGPEDIAPDTLEAMQEDCNEFVEHNGELIAESGLSDEQAGLDFWLTRNRHDAAFWDRLGEVGRQLSAAAKVYGSIDLNVANGRIHA